MARDFSRKKRLSAVSEINMAPLIDLAFALLIIFMITTPLLEESIRVDLPRTDTGQPAPEIEPGEIQRITIDAAGQTFWGSDPVDDAGLNERMRALGERDRDRVLHIRADRFIHYDEVVRVLELAQRYRLHRLSLDTQRTSDP